MDSSKSLITPSSDSNTLAQAFIMQGAREILEISAGAVHIKKQIESLELAIQNDPGMALDLSRTLVESVCLTILKDKGYEPSKEEKKELPKLLKITTKKLQLAPQEHGEANKVEESLLKMLRGLNDTILGICELRNANGFASHGKDAYFIQTLESTHIHLVARAADAIVNFLFKTHKKNILSSSFIRIKYEEKKTFNEYLDDFYEAIEIFELRYRPSEILYALDREAYCNLLTEFENKNESQENEEDSESSLHS
jgi:hypothetical protein